MKLNKTTTKNGAKAGILGFTLVETIVAVWLGSMMISALYASYAWGFASIGVTRENLRATQILLGRVEALRVCTFSQVSNPTNTPPIFTEYFDPQDQASGAGGTVYSGTTTVAVPSVGSLPESYRTNIVLVTLEVSWNSGKLKHTKSLQTYVARDGMESYVSTGK